MKPLFEHQGHGVGLTGIHTFKILSAPEEYKDSIGQTFNSAAEATTWINDSIKWQAKQKREKLELPTVDSAGKHVHITGIHASRGVILPEGSHYPRAAWVEEDLARFRKINQERERLVARLNALQINRKTYYGRLSSDQYNVAVEHIKNEHTKKTELAKQGRDAVIATLPERLR